MERTSRSRLDAPAVRFLLMVAVVILLNFGLFFMLNFLAPLVTGLIVGFLLAKIRDGLAIGFVGTVLSYCLVFLISEWFLNFSTPIIDVVGAVIIMGAIGAFGGLIGSLISSRFRK
ncbi:MAG: hypothetical protein ACFFEK_11110 [Candidatus Thorarchaeota archaeon]